MLGSVNRLFRRKDGATIIEFALILPVFLLLLLGIIEFSLVMFVSSVIEGATAAAARMSKTGLGRSTEEDVAVRAQQDLARFKQVILDRGYDIIKSDKLQVLISPAGGSPANTVGGSGEMVTYDTTYTWTLQTPIISSIIGDDGVLELHAQTVVINEPYEDDPENENETD